MHPYTKIFLANPGEARGCSINSLVIHRLIHSLIDSFIHPFPPTALRHHHTQTVRDRASSYKIDYVVVNKSYLNPKGHQNPIIGSKLTTILLKGWIWPIGEASSGKGLRSTGLPRLVLLYSRKGINRIE